MYKPIYQITPYLLNLIDDISSLRAWIEKQPLQVAWLPILQKEARTRNTHSSTAIEGNPLTLSQVEAVERGEKTGMPINYEKEVQNNLKCIRWIEKQTNQKSSFLKLSERTVFHLHKILMRGLLPLNKCGKYKDKQNYIINERGIKIYKPPSPQDTPRLMRDLIGWLNSEEARILHPILICAIFHYRFVAIHPFSDGNGRMARLLSTWILYKREYDSLHIFSLDDYFAGDRKKYYLKIQQTRDLDENLRCWLEYVAEGIKVTLENIKRRIEQLQISTRTKIVINPRQEELIFLLRDDSPKRVSDIQKKLKLTRARINQIILPLIKSGIVVREGVGKATTYRLMSI